MKTVMILTTFIICMMIIMHSANADGKSEPVLAIGEGDTAYILHAQPCRLDIINRKQFLRFEEIIPPLIIEGCWAMTVDEDHIITVAVFKDLTGNGQSETEEKVWPKYRFWPAMISADGTRLSVMNPETKEEYANIRIK